MIILEENEKKKKEIKVEYKKDVQKKRKNENKRIVRILLLQCIHSVYQIMIVGSALEHLD